ncbi:MAG: sigma-70 family RNA polymerase sigma factor [Nocardioidaceae bacterium]|nr:sigma-70 family RNA polymerase sigma factor [Nocardioidaceae bacterium]
MTTIDVDRSFAELTEPLRGEITAHCYRMLGSVHDAEDLVQETYLRAWRAFHGFEGRSSVRTWLHRIATNACLNALESRQRRPLPTGLGQPASDPSGALRTREEVPWLEPLPDDLVWGRPDAEPGEQTVSRESVRIALVAALQHLTPQQRAVVVLRDVLAWQAKEVAETLDMTVAGVNSTLQRARVQLAKLEGGLERPAPVLDDARSRRMLAAYVAAFEEYDVPRIVSLLAEDAVWEMPPFDGWYRGAEAIGTLISTNCPADAPGDQVLVPVSGNGQPCFGLYMRGEDGVHRAFQIQQLTVGEHGVEHVVAYFDLSLFARFGLPETLPADRVPRTA